MCVASHELKTPLTPLKLQMGAFARAVRNGTPWTPERMTRMVEMADAQIARLTQLINDLLDVSSSDAESLDLRYEVLDLAELAGAVVEQRRAALQAAGCTVELVCDAAAGEWDRSRLQHLLNNLLENAAKYAPGGAVVVHVAAYEESATVVVRDHGPGIPPQHQSKIFERFERAGASVISGGLGLGLYISRQIALAHGGDIRVRNASDGGASFALTLPTRPPPKMAGAVTRPRNLSRAGGEPLKP